MLIHILTVRNKKNVPVQQCRLAFTDISQANAERDRVTLSRIFTSLGGDNTYTLQEYDFVIIDTLSVIEPVLKNALDRHLNGVAFNHNSEFKPQIPVWSTANTLS